MNFPIEKILVNAGYIIMLLALAVRDMLMLRSILMTSQLFIVIYAILIKNSDVAFWISLFFLINAVQLIRLIRERRPIELFDELEELYGLIFTSMSKREFLLFWNMGTRDKGADEKMIKKGERLDKLFLILSGSVEVIKDGKKIAYLTKGNFIAEMSFLTGEPASADIIAKGAVEYICWNQDKLRNIGRLHQTLLIKLQNILGKDLVNKIKIASEGAYENAVSK